MASTMDSPRPVLPEACDRAPSARTNRSNTCGTISGEMPGPVSTTDNVTALAARSSETSVVITVPGGVWARAFASRFASAWCSRCSSPQTTTGSSNSSSYQR